MKAQGYRAAVCSHLGGPDSLQTQTLARPPLAAGEVRVRIAAAGVNFPDLLMTRGEYQFRPPLPFVPGMEAAGVITEVAPDVRSRTVGQRVMLNDQMGLYAEEAVVMATAIVPAPPELTYPQSACLMVATRTAHHALVDRAQVKAGETVLVLGAAGGVGLAAVEIAHLLGARVIAAASSQEKLEIARSRGASYGINYSSSDLVEETRRLVPDGVDVVFDPVGGDLFEQALRLPAWGGRVLVVGFASGKIGRAAANRLLIRGYSVMGVRAGEAGRRDPNLLERYVRDIEHWIRDGKLRPMITRTFPLESAGAALKEMDERRALGRIAIITDRELV